jgi:cytochrome P450/DNA-binding transcriptional regulator PaaX
VTRPLLPRLQAGSSSQHLLTTLLGDYWAGRAEHLPSAALIALLGEFDVGPAAARAALNRLARRELLVTSRSGRNTYYGFAPGASDTLLAGAREFVAFGQAAEDWDGRWTLAVFTLAQGRRDLRYAVRSRLRWLGFAPLYDGTWVSPRSVAGAARRELARLGIAEVTVFRAEAEPESARSPVEAWNLGEIAATYHDFMATYGPLREQVRGGAVGATQALLARTRLMDSWRSFPGVDPDLPAALLPPSWPRREAQQIFAELYDALGPLAAIRVRQIIERHAAGLAPLITHRTTAQLLGSGRRPADFDPGASDDPEQVHALYRRLRAQCPVAHSDAYGGFWALTTHREVRDAALDDRTFISSVKAVVPSDPRGLRRPPLNFDAPAHTPYRKALDRTLSRDRISELEPALRRHAAAALEPMIVRGSGDIAQEFGAEFPAWVTAEWLNLDPALAPVLAATAARWVRAWRAQDKAVVNETSGRLYAIARDLVADRRANPRPAERDPASSLLTERHDGRPLDEEQIVGALRQSLVVGMVAPPIIIGSIAVHLAEDRALQDRLRAEPGLIPAALEEFLRLYAPYRGFARTVSVPTSVLGTRIEPGEPVTLTYASANRDAAVFADPDEFRLDRENVAEHLAFGRGRHRCPGAPLARLMLLIAVRELLARTRSFTAVGRPEGARMPELGVVSARLEFAR